MLDVSSCGIAGVFKGIAMSLGFLSDHFDRNGYATATSEELTRYIKNIYYVLLTRGVMGTHVYVANPALREYLRRFFVG